MLNDLSEVLMIVNDYFPILQIAGKPIPLGF